MITFYNHEVVGERMATVIADRFRMSKDEKDLFVRLVAQHQFVVSEELTDNAIRRFIRNVGRENLEEMFALRHADRLGGAATETSWRTELFKKRVAELLIEPFTVKDVMKILNIKPSRQVGDILDALFEKVVNKEIENDREVLIQQLSLLSKDIK
jgi:poly(A) polymerase/tRNA nucleotidyltransferase (CCA-adding enzyme)